MVAMKSQKSFTLIELLVTVTIFSLIVGAASGVFVSALRAQRKSLSMQELLGQTSFLMEYMSRAIRMAKKDIDGNCISAKLNYEKTTSGTGGMRFKNYQGTYCQEFFREWDAASSKYRLKEWKKEISTGAITTNYLTSPSLNVTSFNIGPDESWDQNDNDQPRVTFFLKIEGKEKSKINLQTTISQRNLDI